MNTIEDDKYEGMAAEYQYRLIEILDHVLQRHDIGPSKRREVCGEFAFDLGMLHDQGEIRCDSVSYEPMIAFESGNDLYVCSESFEFHEYAFGNASEYFEQDDS